MPGSKPLQVASPFARLLTIASAVFLQLVADDEDLYEILEGIANIRLDELKKAKHEAQRKTARRISAIKGHEQQNTADVPKQPNSLRRSQGVTLTGGNGLGSPTLRATTLPMSAMAEGTGPFADKKSSGSTKQRGPLAKQMRQNTSMSIQSSMAQGQQGQASSDEIKTLTASVASILKKLEELSADVKAIKHHKFKDHHHQQQKSYLPGGEKVVTTGASKLGIEIGEEGSGAEQEDVDLLLQQTEGILDTRK